MKGIQEKYGRDKVQVLLLSVDLGYGVPADKSADGDRKRMEKAGVADWPNVLLPDGMKTSLKQFNLDGYGLSLIDPDGIVRGIDIRSEEAEALMAKIYKH